MIPRIIEFNNKKLVINQNLEYKYAGEVWDAALVLVYFLLNKKSEIVINLKDKIILELGAGTGILGLTTGLLSAKKVVLTDKEGCTKLLKENYELNKNLFNDNFECEIKELDWLIDKDKYNIVDKFDFIIGSDLVWNPNLREGLVNTIKYFLNSKDDTQAIFSFQIRDKEIEKFFNLFEKDKFIIEKLPDNLYDENFFSEDIIIVRIKKK